MNGSLNDTKYELSNAKSEISDLNGQISNLQSNLESTKSSLSVARKERDEAKEKLSEFKNEIGESIPILITDIEIANTYNGGDIETDYGNSIYSSNTMYLKPRITYKGIKTGENIDLSVRLYTPSGLSTGTSSPSGYSYSTSIYVYSGENKEALTSWGGSSRGHWSRGTYRFEIWHNNVCLKSKTFSIY